MSDHLLPVIPWNCVCFLFCYRRQTSTPLAMFVFATGVGGKPAQCGCCVSPLKVEKSETRTLLPLIPGLYPLIFNDYLSTITKPKQVV